VQDQIEKTYQHMNKTPYYLHAILIHDGNASSGHYYAFIYDHHQKLWRKYNDIRVTEESEETVIKESVGGKGWASAYWLVYVNEATAKELSSLNINSFKPLEGAQVDLEHPYARLLSMPINRLVEEEN